MSMPATTTTLIVEGDLVIETKLGTTWEAAMQGLWEGQQVWPLRVLALDLATPSIADRTSQAATQLAERTFREGCVPQHLQPMFDAFNIDGFDEELASALWAAEHRLSRAQLGVGAGR